MAPQQQNSTFIDDNLDSCPSLLNLPESPILPTRRCQNQGTNNHKQHHNKQVAFEERLVDAALPLAPPVMPPPTCKNKHSKGSGNGGPASRRHRSISLYGVNSTVEQGHKEIPIWMDDGEPRYVSGVTNKTTCNDIIKALIDDELSNVVGTGQHCSSDDAKDGGQRATATTKETAAAVAATSTAAASRDYSDYIITESWGGIERSYDGNMAILPVWRAWSRVHNELRLSLKHRDNFRDPMTLQLMPHAPPSGSFSMIKWLKKLLHLSKSKKNMPKPTNTPPKVPNKTKDRCLLNKKGKRQAAADELLLAIMPDQLYSATGNCSKGKLYKLAENRVAKQRRRRRPTLATATETAAAAANPPNEFNNNVNYNYIRRRKDRPLRNSVRNKLASLHADMNVRYEREYALTRQLSEKCRMYRIQNERYRRPEMEVSVGQLQQNIEAYAEDIIKTEHELLDLKNEMRHDISLINNLKRMTLEETAAEYCCGVGVAASKEEQQQKRETPHVAKNANEMQFVDNIYEFCDNNASMLV
ncbi:uncharacterized protein LOC108153561 isoform X1 [Drosophila miranda]|uniref:uncharacterized protein LOC108153561 isoform X1 n=1 Tax=Drosophila miranda TaxID=7229 RepID=UPI0007E76FFE|nr:uncharacterized protein LOC108153561 isoform X1 [Drosophila miranda]XP_017139123.1 uncharacterized protein LOC108153561 isoform X1 [Drosophila miranda]